MNPCCGKRGSCWRSLQVLKDIEFAEGYIFARDFNVVRSSLDKKGGFYGRDPFREILEGLMEEWDLLDIKLQKGRYTWTNMRLGPGHTIARLDRFLIHSNFLSSNSSIKSYILPSLTYDNKPISLHIHDLP